MAKSKQPEENDGLLPESVLHNINEHSIGGFVVFYFNSETGQPEHVLSIDSPLHYLAIQKYIADWSRAMNEASVQMNIENIKQNMEEN